MTAFVEQTKTVLIHPKFQPLKKEMRLGERIKISSREGRQKKSHFSKIGNDGKDHDERNEN